jgi:hypothetical protein
MNSEKHEPQRDTLLSEAVLHAPFKALRAEMGQMDTPRMIEQHLMHTFKRMHPPRRWYQGWSWMQWSMAGGVGSLATIVVVFMLTMQVPLGTAPLPLSLDEGADFIALESLERIEQETDTRVVQASLPRSELAALGVSVTPENANESVRAELLVNADGKALAVRFSE